MNTASITPARRDIRVISLVGLAHGLSHFYALSLPVLFVFMKDDLGVTFTELGFVVTVFYATSGFSQTLAGFATDRFGGPRMLFTGLALFALAYLLMGMAPNYWTLVGCAVISGLGNSVFHPADFSILNSAVDPKRLGYAFSAHGFTGNLGFMLAPVIMGPLAQWFGWHGALTIGGVGAALALAFLVLQREFLQPVERHEQAAAQAAGAGAVVLFSKPVLMCFGFFMLLAGGIVGLQSFGAATFTGAFHMTREAALATLTGFIGGGTAGIAAGGWAAGRTERHEVVAGAGMACSCLLVALVATGMLPLPGIAVALALAGFCSGIAQPSRDMVIRKTAPKGSTGKVYGFVYSGLDAGSSTAPLLFGYLLDHHHGDAVMWCVAAFWGVAMFTIATVQRNVPQPLPKAA
ncbi:MAG TPA: MFS transporter [Burkholderiales bacterium]|nr:MFS transporter [Burkholderiales bacterium]